MDTPSSTPGFHAALCITCGEEYPGSWTGECDCCEQSTAALWLNFATAEKREGRSEPSRFAPQNK
jgi:hypothetical protein